MSDLLFFFHSSPSMEEFSLSMKALCELQCWGGRTRIHVNKKSQPSSVHPLPHFSLIYFISVWYFCYQSSVYLTPDRGFPVQDVAFIMPELQPTLAKLSQPLQFLQIFIETCCWTITFQKNVSFHLQKDKILGSMLVEESLHKMKSKPEF